MPALFSAAMATGKAPATTRARHASRLPSDDRRCQARAETLPGAAARPSPTRWAIASSSAYIGASATS